MTQPTSFHRYAGGARRSPSDSTKQAPAPAHHHHEPSPTTLYSHDPPSPPRSVSPIPVRRGNTNQHTTNGPPTTTSMGRSSSSSNNSLHPYLKPAPRPHHEGLFDMIGHNNNNKYHPKLREDDDEEECKMEIAATDEDVPSVGDDGSQVPPYMTASSLRHMVKASHNNNNNKGNKGNHRHHDDDPLRPLPMGGDMGGDMGGSIEAVPTNNITILHSSSRKKKPFAPSPETMPTAFDATENSNGTSFEGYPKDEEEDKDLKGKGNQRAKPHHNEVGDDNGSNSGSSVLFGGMFQDVTRYELFMVFCFFLAATLVATTVSVVVTRKDSGGGSDGSNVMGPEFGSGGHNGYQSPTYAPSKTLTPQEQLETIRAAVTRNPITYPYGLEMPTTLDDIGLEDHLDSSKSPAFRSLAWIVYVDPQDGADEILTRFALAVLYYSMGGDEWAHKDGWLSDKKLCVPSPNGASEAQQQEEQWYGVKCNNFYNPQILEVSEVELSANGLTGEIADSLVLIPSLRALWLDRNAITGPMDPELFAAMHNLQFLYVQHNLLSGPIPNTFLKNGMNLRTIFLHGNQFSGIFPPEYCPACPGCQPPLLEFGVDCKKNACSCCDDELNCH